MELRAALCRERRAGRAARRPSALRELEPHVAGVAALHVLDTGIVDYAAVCRALAAEIEAAGATIRLGCAVRVGGRDGATGLVVETTSGPIEAQRVVTCAGLHADQVAEARERSRRCRRACG